MESASRARFRAAMAHRPPDRTPIDLACTSLTGMSASAQRRLLAYLGLTDAGPQANHGVDERILAWAGSDFRSVGGIVSLPGTLERVISPTERVDCWGVRRRLVGEYWEIVGRPLAGATLDDLRAFPWPTPRLDDALLAGWQAEARRLAEQTPYVVIGEHPVFGVLELGCWMCGYDEFLARMALDPAFVRAFFDRFFEIQLAVIEPYYRALGPYLDLTMSGDDFGQQWGPLISPVMFRELVAPYFRARIRRTQELAPCYYWHHTCGSVVGLLDDLAACGVQILNPIQTSAAGMDPAALKARAGQRLVFWGAIDVQAFLRTATPDAVYTAVGEIIGALGREGGYVLAPGHNIQGDVPPENIAAMIAAAQGGEVTNY